MALTPDDVVTKQFQHVRFKEGFDPDEVDDFLDEIVVEWRKTIAENEELKAKLAALESGEAPAAEAPVVESDEVVAEVDAPVAEAEVVDVESAAEVDEAPAHAPAAADVATSAGIIELAQRLHAEHVAEGESKRAALISEGESTRDQLVSEAEATRDRLVSEAEEKAAKIVADAQATSRTEIARLTLERDDLETRVSELRQFESDYRTQLRSFIEEKLSDLDTTGTSSVAPAGE